MRSTKATHYTFVAFLVVAFLFTVVENSGAADLSSDELHEEQLNGGLTPFKQQLNGGLTPFKQKPVSELTFDELVDDLKPESYSTGERSQFKKFFDAGRYERALLLESSGDIEHDQSKFVHIIVCQYLLGRYKEAIGTCEKWLAANPNASKSSIAFVYEFIGDCHYENHELQPTIDAFTKALEVDSKRDVDTMLDDARNLLKVKNKEMSKEDFVQNGVKRKRTSRGLQSKLGEFSWMHRTNPFFEIPFPSKSPGSIKPGATESASALAEQGQKLENSGEFEQAAERYKESLKIDKSDAASWTAYGLSLMMITAENDDKNLQEVVRALIEAIRVAKKDWRTWNNLGAFVLKMDYRKSDKTAKECFEAALKCSDVPESQRHRLKEKLNFYARIDKMTATLKSHYGIKKKSKHKK